MHAILTLDTVPLETLESWNVLVTLAQLDCLLQFVLLENPRGLTFYVFEKIIQQLKNFNKATKHYQNIYISIYKKKVWCGTHTTFSYLTLH